MTPSYLSQVHQLRRIAQNALAAFPLRAPSLHFIQHGENTTFQVRSGSNRYLLRIHRAAYHSPEALKEELAWLERLAQVPGLRTPIPLRSRSGEYLCLVNERWCDLLAWVPGSFLRKRMPPFRIHQLGALAATLQKHARGQSCRHRHYWSADGLVGASGKFGAIDALAGIPRRSQEKVTAGRRVVHARLRAFERRFPARSGLIHADLHFGNFVISGDQLGAIDFDDCGFGFHAYDLAVPLTQLENLFVDDWGKYLALYEQLQVGYASVGPWDSHDEAVLPTLITARRLLMLGWLQSRTNNPKYREILPGAVERALAHMERFGTLKG